MLAQEGMENTAWHYERFKAPFFGSQHGEVTHGGVQNGCAEVQTYSSLYNKDDCPQPVSSILMDFVLFELSSLLLHTIN